MRFMRTNCNVLATWKIVLTASKDDEWWCMEWQWQVEVDRRATVGKKWHFSQSHSVSASSSIRDACWISSSVSKQWPINLFFIFKKWTKLQRAKSDEWSRWWAKILLVWAKKNKKRPVFSVSSEPAWDVLLASTAVQIVSSECSPSGHNSQIWYRHSHPGGWIYGAQPDED